MESCKSTDCYGSWERAAMNASRRFRIKLFGPLLPAIDKWGVSADAITLISLVFGLAFCPLYFESVPMALTALLVHVVLDGLDGTVARLKGTASPKGSLADTMADQIGVTGVTATLIVSGMVGTYIGVIYVFLYTLVVVFSVVRLSLIHI